MRLQKKRSLYLLRVEKTELKLELDKLTKDINLSTSLTESHPHIVALVKAKNRLASVEVDITCVKRDTDRVNEMYSNLRKVK